MTTENIQQLKEDIAILQMKLKKLEEQDPEVMLLRQGKIDIVDYDGKKYFRIEYTDSFAPAYCWYKRKAETDAMWAIRDVNEYKPLEELYQKKVLKQKEDYPYKKYTPEETEQSLREAFKKAQESEKWKQLQKQIDEPDNDKKFKNSLELIREWGEANKAPTLYQLIENWWTSIFTNHIDGDRETCINLLVDIIDDSFIPSSHNSNDYQWNKCLKVMRNKLR